MNLVDPHAAAEAHALARAGDRDAMDRLILMFGRWIAHKVRNPPKMVDPDDAESFAMESIWLAARECESPLPIASFARQAFHYKVMTHRRKSWVRLGARNLQDWAPVAGSEVRFPPVTHDAPPCTACGTTGGEAPKDQHTPKRSNGLCNVCYMRDYHARRKAK